ncbi:MAG: hypothetical protein JSV52_15320 [Candidatus Zixiibacteriota bacterium]|nr:MAG: hypothetical protein JSV52_15320 [candidate division Zixibacteria bacterium]
MKRLVRYSMLMGVALMVFSSSAEAISRRSSKFSLRQRSQIELRFGVREDTYIDNDYYFDGLVWRRASNGLVVSLGFNHWTDETTAINLTVKALATDFDDGVYDFGIYDRSYSVVPILVGFRKYLGPASGVRPYLAVSAGPVIGTETTSLAGIEVLDETLTQAAAGAYFGGGIDFIVGRHFMLGMNAGYNLLSDFDVPVGGHVNYSGAEFGVGFGLVF